MSRLYLKIFAGFWLISVLTLLGHSVYVHWIDRSSEFPILGQFEDPSDKDAVRAITVTTNWMIHWDLPIVRAVVANSPEWIFRRVYVVDENGKEARGRVPPPEVHDILDHLSADNPFYLTHHDDKAYAGRYLLLADGGAVKIASFSTPFYGSWVAWRLNFQGNWPLYLISMLISGIACFIFARHMSRDIHTLQKATQDIARGDLSVRLAPTFANRKDELADLSRDFDNMTERLETSMEEQRRLIKDVSHELRSPLARLQLALGLAQKKANPETRDNLARVKSAADYLNDLITTILSFPTNEQEKWELSDTMDIKVMLETLVDDFALEAKEKSVKMRFQPQVDEALVATHGNTLISMFENIIGNALHYTYRDTVIEVRLEQQGQYCLASVLDQGPGVPDDKLHSIFEPFYRTDEARDRASGGYGLGLSIAQRTAELHHGQITASNRSKGGLCVAILLPALEL